MTRGFAAALREELDFRIEARNIAAVASSSRVRVPAVYGQWSTRRVLVMEYLDGVAVRHAEPVLADSGADRHGLARGLLAAMLGQVMAEGTFHADPHPGNVLVLRDGQLALIDFGSAGRLDPLQQAALRRLLLAVARRNPAGLHDSLLDLAQAARPAAAGDDLLEPVLARFLAQHLGPGMVPDAAMFTTLFRLVAEFGLVFPPVIAAVFRAMITLEGTLARLAPAPWPAALIRTGTGSWPPAGGWTTTSTPPRAPRPSSPARPAPARPLRRPRPRPRFPAWPTASRRWPGPARSGPACSPAWITPPPPVSTPGSPP
jgi:ubiquinone biosynthesis protein